MKRNNRNIFVLFVFWKDKIKQQQQIKQTQKENETWIYKVPTKYDIEMSGLSVYLPPSLGFWHKWKSIPGGPLGGATSIV